MSWVKLRPLSWSWVISLAVTVPAISEDCVSTWATFSPATTTSLGEGADSRLTSTRNFWPTRMTTRWPGILEAFGRDGDVVGADGKGGDDPFTVVIGDGVAGDADGGVVITTSAPTTMAPEVSRTVPGEGGGVLGEGGGGAEEKREQAASLAKKFHLRLQVAQSTRGFCEPEC